MAKYQINEDALCTIKKGADHNLFMGLEIFDGANDSNIHKFSEAFCLEDAGFIFKLDVLEKLKNYLVNNEDFKVFDKIRDFRYCEDISSKFQGFKVELQKEISAINYEITQINKVLNYEKGQESKSNDESYFVKRESKLVREVVESYFRKITLWCKAYAINGAYKQCANNPDVLYHSHRILGWSKPERNLHEDLSVEFKTNFGFGNSSYFFLKIKYQGFDIVSFVDAVQYPYWDKNENVFYTRKYDLLNTDDLKERYGSESLHNYWIDAFKYCSWVVNLLNKSRAQFVEEVILDALTSLIKYLNNLKIVNKNSKSQYDPVISVHDKSSKKHINGIEALDTDLSVIEVSNPELNELFQICNAFNFIPLIETYSAIVSKKDTVDDLYRLAKMTEPNVPSIISNIEHEIEVLSQSVKTTINSLSLMKEQHEKYEIELKKQRDSVHKAMFEDRMDYKVFYVRRSKLFDVLHGYEEHISVHKNDLNRCKKLFKELQIIVNNK